MSDLKRPNKKSNNHKNKIVKRSTKQKKSQSLIQAEKKYIRLIQDIKEGVWVFDRQGNTLFVNNQMARMLGYKVAEMRGESWYRFTNEVQRKKIARYLSQIDNKKINKIETTFLRKDGTETHTYIYTYPIYNDNGKDVNFINIISNITELNKIATQLVLSERRYRELADSLSQAIFEVDMKGNITYENKAFNELTGYINKNSTNDLNISKIIVDQDGFSLSNVLKKNAKSSDELRYEYLVLKKNGQYLPAMLALKPVARNSINIGWRGTITDLTDQKRAEEEKSDIQQKALMASHLASIGELASGLAHEVNNPLASIVLYTQLLMEENLPEKVKTDVISIYESALRATNIIRRLLTFARQQLQKKIAVNINDVIAVTLELRRYALETSNIKVKTKLDYNLPLTMADPEQIQQVFLNIILNAETEMKLNHNKGNLSIKTEKVDDFIRILFEDDGPGIPKENIKKIFNPFFTTREVGEGTGLGLSICHGIVSDHGGKIYVESEEGYGATFYVELPILTCEKVSVDEKLLTVADVRANNLRILIVDDELSILDSLSRILIKNGYQVETVDNCHSALHMILNKKYDCILLDIKLPDMSGIELYTEINNRDESIAKKIIFITGNIMDQETKQFLEETQVPYSAKPFEITELIRQLKYFLSENSRKR